MSQQSIFLIGLMAVGKSTVGRCLADELDLPFFDSDQQIEERAGAEISWIFDVEGDEGFREREAAVVDDLTQRQGIVLATGGGVVKRADNRTHLAARGVVIHLHCPFEKLLARTSRDKRRPLLQGTDRAAVLRKLMCERGPLYEEIADYTFESSEQSAKVLVGEIVAQLRADGIVV